MDDIEFEREKTGNKKRIYPEIMCDEHIPGVAVLDKLCFSSPWSEESLKLLTKDGIGVGMVCVSGGEICAYGGMLCAVDEGQITNIATHPDMRRRGYGRAVVQSLKKYALDNGINSVSLEVRESNFAAISLYESLGFKTVGKRRDFYTKPTEAGLVMVCKLR